KHLLDTSKSATIDTNVLIHQIPGGMQSNMVNQLRAADALDRLHEVHAELPRTRKDLGTPPLVTPTSQIVGTQAVMNVLQGRYNVVSDQVRDLCYGLYGKTPTPIDPEVQKICLKGYKRGETPITGRPGDYIDPEMPAAKEAVAELYKQAGKSGEPSRDHVILYALFERTGKDYISWSLGLTDKMPGEKARTYEEVEAEDALVRKAQAGQVVPKPDVELSENARTFKVQVDGETIEVKVEAEGGMPVIAAVASAAPAARATSSAPKPAAAPRSESPTPKATKAAPVAEGQVAVTAPMPGTVLGYLVKEGDTVEAGQPVVTLEAMKMENQLPAPAAGKVVSVACESGATVAKGDQLLVIASA
ncbi:biotin/lipoyl-binding protein, partial [bacterium]|nr:biotin/lipoyl-binding protein [bacterium]